jgi:hypothetical protein
MLVRVMLLGARMTQTMALFDPAEARFETASLSCVWLS